MEKMNRIYKVSVYLIFGFQPHQLAQRHALPYQDKRTEIPIEVAVLFKVLVILLTSILMIFTSIHVLFIFFDYKIASLGFAWTVHSYPCGRRMQKRNDAVA